MSTQWERVLEALACAPPEGFTLEEIYCLTDVPAASASATIRCMREQGVANIKSLRPPSGQGPWTYRLEKNPREHTYDTRPVAL